MNKNLLKEAADIIGVLIVEAEGNGGLRQNSLQNYEVKQQIEQHLKEADDWKFKGEKPLAGWNFSFVKKLLSLAYRIKKNGPLPVHVKMRGGVDREQARRIAQSYLSDIEYSYSLNMPYDGAGGFRFHFTTEDGTQESVYFSDTDVHGEAVKYDTLMMDDYDADARQEWVWGMTITVLKTEAEKEAKRQRDAEIEVEKQRIVSEYGSLREFVRKFFAVLHKDDWSVKEEKSQRTFRWERVVDVDDDIFKGCTQFELNVLATWNDYLNKSFEGGVYYQLRQAAQRAGGKPIKAGLES